MRDSAAACRLACCHSGQHGAESTGVIRNPVSLKRLWIPAFAGMTMLLLCFLSSPAFAASEPSELYFKGPSDLVMKTDELSIGRKIPCQLSVHYRGKDPSEAFVKVYLDAVNITSFPVSFKRDGTVTADFSFRVEVEKKHYLEFVIKTAGEVKDANPINNRLLITFRVPGEPPKFVEPVRPKAPERILPPPEAPKEEPKSLNETVRPLAFTENAMRESLPKIGIARQAEKSLNERVMPDREQQLKEKADLEAKLEKAKKEFVRQTVIQREQKSENAAEEIAGIEEGYQDFDEPDAMAYFDQPESQDVENLPSDNTPLSEGKPVIDLFFIGDDAFKLYPQEVSGAKIAAWKLLLSSNGVGEADIEVVVASGGKKLVSQKIHVRGGESMELPMQASFDRTGPHKMTAMINTLNNVVDNNLDNNIVETRINIG